MYKNKTLREYFQQNTVKLRNHILNASSLVGKQVLLLASNYILRTLELQDHLTANLIFLRA